MKLFVTASAECRAGRRQRELAERGHPQSLDSVLADVKERDRRDRERSAAPLVPARDAIELDTSDLAVDEAIARAIEIVQAALDS